MQRLEDQILFLSDAVSSLEKPGSSFLDASNDSLYYFLQSQISIANDQNTKLEKQIHDTDMQNFLDNVQISFDNISSNSELNSEQATSILDSYFEKLKTLNLSYEDRYLSSTEEKVLHEREEHEHAQYAEFAQAIDDANNDMKQMFEDIKSNTKKIIFEKQALLESERMSSGSFLSKMDLLKKASDFLSESSSKSRFNEAVLNFFKLLQNPFATEEEIKVTLESVVTIARLEASTEVDVPEYRSIQKTLQQLKEKLEANKPNVK
ncbi:hypothetical protein GPJ56_008689 [Histomonas meleagridis]|uniref:uncharacterized protein n=1 Tax=Histomonas meleagridis TaxID=135588 RepID=UPI0035599F17|nr:hypothetical protein GPJ56_008689 [Histomonas meleagridis]KAH0805732.1 hypothetical protein GO595_001371 [Histomonas meleagridis]